jgi:hypothetical protein
VTIINTAVEIADDDTEFDQFCSSVAQTMVDFDFDLDDVTEFIDDNVENVREFWESGRSDTAVAHILASLLMD